VNFNKKDIFLILCLNIIIDSIDPNEPPRSEDKSNLNSDTLCTFVELLSACILSCVYMIKDMKLMHKK